MPAAQLSEFKSFLGDLVADVPDAQLQQFLDDAQQSVIAGGVPESHSRFAELQRYLTAHNLNIANLLKNTVVGESVDGVSVSMQAANPQPGSPQSSYIEIYRKKRREILGMESMGPV